MILGMIPDRDLPMWARRAMPPAPALASHCWIRRARTTIEELVRRVEKIETAIEPRFQAHFVEAMAIPHKSAQYPELIRW